jgi:hypothetical protein
VRKKTAGTAPSARGGSADERQARQHSSDTRRAPRPPCLLAPPPPAHTHEASLAVSSDMARPVTCYMLDVSLLAAILPLRAYPCLSTPRIIGSQWVQTPRHGDPITRCMWLHHDKNRRHNECKCWCIPVGCAHGHINSLWCPCTSGAGARRADDRAAALRRELSVHREGRTQGRGGGGGGTQNCAQSSAGSPLRGAPAERRHHRFLMIPCSQLTDVTLHLHSLCQTSGLSRCLSRCLRVYLLLAQAAGRCRCRGSCVLTRGSWQINRTRRGRHAWCWLCPRIFVRPRRRPRRRAARVAGLHLGWICCCVRGRAWAAATGAVCAPCSGGCSARRLPPCGCCSTRAPPAHRGARTHRNGRIRNGRQGAMW